MNKVAILINTSLVALALSLTTNIQAATIPAPAVAATMPQPDTSLAPMLKNVMPAIVNIAARGEIPINPNPFRPQSQQKANGPKFESMGSGVLVDAKNGYIITNAHVVSDAKFITVTLNDGRHFQAKLIGADNPSDIAVIQIQAPDLRAVTFGNSNTLQVGDYVVAIGSPFDLKQSVTSGIVSGLGRSGLGIEGYEDFIQTDAPINPGNSGGALVNLQGQLIGLNTAILSANGGSLGIGFAIPSQMLQGVMAQLIKYGDVERGVIGVVVQDLNPALAQAFRLPINTEGALVTTVTANSPTEKAGIQVGDIITQANGESIKGAAQLRNAVGLTRVGGKVTINFIRNTKPMTVHVISEEADKIKEKMMGNLGYLSSTTLQDFSEYIPTRGQISGVRVLHVNDASAAWNGGLRRGDVITQVNGQPAADINTVAKLAAANTKTPLLLQVLRGNGALFVVIQ